ncbi:hypothetical protein [Methyloglobulus sp.]|uniref:hypothetical protein n=1 Tax=Methyloglobulus sp. TaxID=2518622 RepID=UPI0039896332
MDEDNFISDEEELYRSVRKLSEIDSEYIYDDTGHLIFTKDAFRDQKKEPSVDRAKLRNFNPSLSKLSETDGIVSLITKEVRSIGKIETKGDVKNLSHAVDVIYNPIHDEHENLAHSLITVEPKFFGSENKQKKAFKLLRIALARLATQRGWKLEPK